MCKKRGRPKDPNAIRDLPRVIVSVPPQVREAIQLLCERQNYSPSQLVVKALLEYIDRLPPEYGAHVGAMLHGISIKDPAISSVDVPLDAKPAVAAFVRLWVNPKNSHEQAVRRFFLEFCELTKE